ncbi:MAG TPA: hypothetical protein VML75_10085, partial [Kofleriaceae bacterium]|nr:hypothetical protein [Kofleriaceae bacterium]
RRPVPGLRGVVWFRLPVAGDHQAWSAPTLRAVIRGDAVAAEVTAALVARGAGVYDVVVENRGTADGRWPALALSGAIDAIDLIGAYRRDGDRWTPAERQLRPGARAVVGWVTGKELAIDVGQDDHAR